MKRVQYSSSPISHSDSKSVCTSLSTGASEPVQPHVGIAQSTIWTSLVKGDPPAPAFNFAQFLTPVNHSALSGLTFFFSELSIGSEVTKLSVPSRGHGRMSARLREKPGSQSGKFSIVMIFAPVAVLYEHLPFLTCLTKASALIQSLNPCFSTQVSRPSRVERRYTYA